MKKLLFILTVLIALGVDAQDGLNRVNEEGFKTGKWVVEFDDGRTDAIMMYEPEYITRAAAIKQARLEAFMDGGNPPKDSIYCANGLIWIEAFKYDSLKRLDFIERTDKLTRETTFIFGEEREVEVKQRVHSFEGRTGESFTIEVELTNRSGSNISLFSQDTPEQVSFKTIRLPKGATETLSAVVQMVDGQKLYEVVLTNGELEVDLVVETKGFSLTTAEVDESVAIKLPSEFHYLRTGKEALLNLKDSKSNETIKRIPLSHRFEFVDLSDLPNGTYLIEKVNYSEETKSVCYIELTK